MYGCCFLSAGCFHLFGSKERSCVASIILKSSDSGGGFCQLRVKYFSNATPLFFTSGSTDVSPGLMTISLTMLDECNKKRGGGCKEGRQNMGRGREAASLHYAPYVIFVEGYVNKFPACSLGQVVLLWNLRDEAGGSLFWPLCLAPPPPPNLP